MYSSEISRRGKYSGGRVVVLRATAGTFRDLDALLAQLVQVVVLVYAGSW